MILVKICLLSKVYWIKEHRDIIWFIKYEAERLKTSTGWITQETRGLYGVCKPLWFRLLGGRWSARSEPSLDYDAH